MEHSRRQVTNWSAALALSVIATGTPNSTLAAQAEAGAAPHVVIRRLSGAPRLDDFEGMEPRGVAREMAQSYLLRP